MQHDGVVQPGGLMQYVLPAVVIAVVFAFRARRMTRARPLKLWQLWIMPAFITVMAALAFVFTPPSGIGWLIAAIAMVIGAGLGWQRGRMMHIEVDAETGELRQRASPLAILFLIGLVVVRSVARVEGRALHLDVVMLSDALLAMVVGTFIVMRIEMFLRAKRLMREHQRAVFS